MFDKAMALFSQNLELPSTGTLYHYTDSAGFLGIAQKKMLWATHCAHLNDTTEYRHAWSVVRKLMARSVEQAVGYEREQLEYMQRIAEAAPPRNIGLVSFSENGDQLSQWRAYGRSLGYSIQFDANELRKRARTDWLLVKCEYDLQRQEQLLQGLISIALEAERTGIEAMLNGHAVKGMLNLADLIGRFALVFKDPGFAEEKEWRLIEIAGPRKPKFRPGRSGVIPFGEFDFSVDEGQHPVITGLIVGPRQDMNLAVETARSVLTAHRIDTYPPPPPNVSPASLARPSTIPFREW